MYRDLMTKEDFVFHQKAKLILGVKRYKKALKDMQIVFTSSDEKISARKRAANMILTKAVSQKQITKI